MASTDDEDELLRSVALRNAHSILLARQRAEQDLAEATQALEHRSDELARSLSMMRATLESTSDGLLVTDGRGVVTGFNERFVTMWGVSRALLDGSDHAQLLRVTSEQVKQPESFLSRTADIYATSPMDSVDLLELTDGRVFERFSRIQFLEEQNVGRVWSFRDITTRQRAEELLEKQSEWLRITLSSIGDAVISIDADGLVTFLNGVGESLTGWKQADALGQPLQAVFRIINQETREPVDNPALRALRDGVTVGLANHTLLIARDGTERAIDDSAAPMRDRAGATVGAVLVFRDVSDAVRSQETQARLAAIVESSQDAVISKTLDGVITSWNAEAQHIFGYTPGEAIGQSIALIIPPERADEEAEIMARLRSGQRVDHFDTVRLTKSGKRVDISVTISPVRDSAGRVIGASKVARDVSSRVVAERALRDADRQKDEFLAVLAHELRNPLAPLQNGLEIVRLADAGSSALMQARDMMERQLRHMVRLVDDLLDVSRINRNQLELRRAPIRLSEVMASAVETARPMIEAARHELIVSMPPYPIELDADLTRLSQVFGNLLSNSAKYSNPGGRIWFHAERRPNEIVVSVRDTGIGIPDEALGQVFDMFSQVDRSMERAAGGLGIGLALVKGIVEMHGGTVIAESEGVNQGSTFTVRLPTSAVSSEAAESPVDPETASTPGRRVLVVDDNRDSAMSMAMILELMGNDVRTAHDGLEAVEVAERFLPQLVLMDVGMPRLNGYDATRRIREQTWGKPMMIVALTGWGQEGDRALSRNSGCDEHLVKPVKLQDLESLLARLESGTDEESS